MTWTRLSNIGEGDALLAMPTPLPGTLEGPLSARPPVASVRFFSRHSAVEAGERGHLATVRIHLARASVLMPQPSLHCRLSCQGGPAPLIAIRKVERPHFRQDNSGQAPGSRDRVTTLSHLPRRGDSVCCRCSQYSAEFIDNPALGEPLDATSSARAASCGTIVGMSRELLPHPSVDEL